MYKRISFTESLKPHLFIGMVLGIWIYLFLVIVGPFDGSTMRISLRTFLMLPYAIIFVVIYVSITPIQNWLFKRRNNWGLVEELVLIAFLYLITIMPTYLYYKSGMIKGEYSFPDYMLQIFLPTIAIFTPIVILTRIFLVQIFTKKSKKESNNVLLVGESKLEALQIRKQDLVCIKSADNYVEVYFLQSGVLMKKMMRLTLKKSHQILPELVRTHRSYLINIDHFISWKDRASIYLNSMEVPVSKTYKDEIHNLISIRHK